MDGWAEVVVSEDTERELHLDMGLWPDVWALALAQNIRLYGGSCSRSPPYTIALIKIS